MHGFTIEITIFTNLYWKVWKYTEKGLVSECYRKQIKKRDIILYCEVMRAGPADLLKGCILKSRIVVYTCCKLNLGYMYMHAFRVTRRTDFRKGYSACLVPPTSAVQAVITEFELRNRRYRQSRSLPSHYAEDISTTTFLVWLEGREGKSIAIVSFIYQFFTWLIIFLKTKPFLLFILM